VDLAQLTLDSIGDAVITTDIDGHITYLNPVAEAMTGWTQHEGAGRPLQQVLRIIDAQSREPALNPLELAIHHNSTVGLSPNCLLIHRDGREFAIEDTASPIRDRNGYVIGAVIVFHDVSAARALSQRMAYLAQHDFLTELPNRMLFHDRLAQAITAAQRNSKALAVLFLDVDHFKGVNDTIGHGGGDQLLQSIARRLVAAVRSSDTVSRYGGDEFVILLSEIAHAPDVSISAKKITAALNPAHYVGGRDLLVTVSVGISVFPVDGTDAGILLSNADMALIRAKSRGRNNCQFFDKTLS
jgi:diguanylate cyclase (GGDEF)-like protein/PAS domain S-box-containing protein